MASGDKFSPSLYQLLEREGIKVLDKVATGSTKTVYKGLLKKKEKFLNVAIKIIPPDFLFSRSAREAFLREADVLKKVQHPNIEKLISAYMTDEFVILVTEFIDGVSVYTYLEEYHEKKGGFIPWELAVEICIRVGSGLEAIHAAGFVHRDLSATNVMLSRKKSINESVKLIDLGLAKNLKRNYLQSLSSIFLIQGTPLFSAPELLEDAMLVDERSDTFSLITLLYYMLTLEYPFGPEEGYYERVKNRFPVPVKHYRNDIPPGILEGLEEVIWVNLSPFPQDRERLPSLKKKLENFLHYSSYSSLALYKNHILPFISQVELKKNRNTFRSKSVLSSPAGKINRVVLPSRKKIKGKKKKWIIGLISIGLVLLAILTGMWLVERSFVKVKLLHEKPEKEKMNTISWVEPGHHRVDNFFGSRVKRVIVRNGTTEIVLSPKGKVVSHRLLFSRKKFIFILKKQKKQ